MYNASDPKNVDHSTTKMKTKVPIRIDEMAVECFSALLQKLFSAASVLARPMLISFRSTLHCCGSWAVLESANYDQ
jgi:hypothetical protein